MGSNWLWLAAWVPVAVGQFGGSGFQQPPPICPAFTCKAKQKAVAKADAQVWAYGCKDSGVNFLSTASLDPNDPLGGLKNQKNVDKCCVEKEICMRTCGMPSKTCFENFQKCSKKICKGDSNCDMMAQFADILNAPIDDEPKKELSDLERRCSTYNQAQREFCECVPKDEWQGAVESRLKTFYRSFNPEKLDGDGEIKDTKSIWKQWKGKESEMFMALTTKYKDKAVQIRKKPKPRYPDDLDAGSAATEQDNTAGSTGADKEETADGGSAGGGEADHDSDDGGFASKLLDLENRKKKAKEDEDYDLAQELKDEAVKLKRAEVERLTNKKDEAIAAEDYLQAKKLKARISKIEL